VLRRLSRELGDMFVVREGSGEGNGDSGRDLAFLDLPVDAKLELFRFFIRYANGSTVVRSNGPVW
jgi:hypothetical protein